MRKRITLKTVDVPMRGANTLKALTSAPPIKGYGKIDTCCGGCGKVIAKGVSPSEIAAKMKTPIQLTIQCSCGAHNVVPGSGLAQ